MHRLDTSATYNFNEKNSFGFYGGATFINTDTNDNVFTNDENNEKRMELGPKYTYRISKYFSFIAYYTFGRAFEARANPSREQYTFHKVGGGINVNF